MVMGSRSDGVGAARSGGRAVEGGGKLILDTKRWSIGQRE